MNSFGLGSLKCLNIYLQQNKSMNPLTMPNRYKKIVYYTRLFSKKGKLPLETKECI